MSSGRLLYTLREPTGSLYGVGFTPDSATLIAAGDDKAIYFWERTTGKLLRSLKGHEKGIRCVRVSHDGTKVASGDVEGVARIWDLSSGQELHCYRGHAKAISSLVFTADDKVLITGGRDQTIRFWEVPTGRLIRRLPAHGMDISGIALSPDDRRLVVSGFEQGVCVLDLASGNELLPRAGHRGWILSTHFSSDGRSIATGSSDGTLRLWDPGTGIEKKLLCRDESGWFIDFAYSPDGHVVAASNYSNQFRLLDSDTGKVLREMAEPEGYISEVRFLGDGNTVATYSFTNERRYVTLWDAKTGRKLWTSPGICYAFAFSPDGKTAALCTSGKGPVLYDTSTGKEIQSLAARGNWDSLAFVLDGSALLLADNDGSLVLWDFAGTRVRHRQKYDHPPGLSHANKLCVSPDGRLAATIADGETGGPGTSGAGFQVWEVSTLQEVAAFQGHRGGINNLEFAPDGRMIASSSADSTVLIWDVLGLASTGQKLGARLDQNQLEALWNDLKGNDAARAYRAIGALVHAANDAVPYLRARLQPVQALAESDLARWLVDLNDPRYEVRRKATAALEQAGELAEDALRQALLKKPSLETRQRITLLLERIDADDHTLTRRAIATLEYSGAAESLDLLKALATGTPQAVRTKQAKAAVARWVTRRHPNY